MSVNHETFVLGATFSNLNNKRRYWRKWTTLSPSWFGLHFPVQYGVHGRISTTRTGHNYFVDYELVNED